MSALQRRLEVARALSAISKTPEGRKAIKEAGYPSGLPIIAVEYDDTIDSVERRLQEYPGQQCLVAMVHRGTFRSRYFTPAYIGVSGAEEISRYSCIGMLFDALQSTTGPQLMRFTDFKLGGIAVGQGVKAAVPA